MGKDGDISRSPQPAGDADPLGGRFRLRRMPCGSPPAGGDRSFIGCVERCGLRLWVFRGNATVVGLIATVRRYFRDHGWSTRVPRRLKDLYIALRKIQEQLSQQHGRSPRPSDIADHLGLSTVEVVQALHAGEAHQCSSLDELLSDASNTTSLGEYRATTLGKHIGRVGTELSLIDHRETLRPWPNSRRGNARSSRCGFFMD